MKNPITSLDDNLDFAPFQAFQYRISPNGREQIKTYQRESGDESRYSVVREPTNKVVYDTYKNVFSAFNVPYYTSKTGGRLTRANTTPDVFTVVIGVVGEKDHESAGFGGASYSISYETLFEMLHEAGFMPLGILLKNKNKINKEIETVVSKCLKSSSKSSPINREYIRSRLESDVGNKWVELVRNYILGAKHPKLSGKTIDIRSKKKDDNPSLYPEGVSHPLIETGNLLDAIKCECFVEQSSAMKHYIDIVRAFHKKATRQTSLSDKQAKRISSRKELREVAKIIEEQGLDDAKVKAAVRKIEKDTGEQYIEIVSNYIEESAKKRVSSLSQPAAWFHIENLLRQGALFKKIKETNNFGHGLTEDFEVNFKSNLNEIKRSADMALGWLKSQGLPTPQSWEMYIKTRKFMYFDDRTNKWKEY